MSYLSPPLFAQSHHIMSYNIRYDNPRDGENSWDKRKVALTSLLAYYHPDIFGIQEGLQHQLAYIDSTLSSYKYIGVGRDDGKTKGEFCAIFFDHNRYKCLLQSTFWLSDQPDKISVGWDAAMERICTYGLFEEKNSPQQFWVFNAHFDHIGPKARAESAKLILQKIKELNTKNLPVILMGDFNAMPDSPPILSFNKEMDDGASISKNPLYGPIGTFNSFKLDALMDRRIDYLFMQNAIVKSYRHIDDRKPNNYHVSDHLPVLVELWFL